jgi:hypothetical protein
MRISTLTLLPAVALFVFAPTRARAQVRVTAHLGPALTINAYSPATEGDWHKNYHKWAPVTVYDYNGHYYSHSVRGARPVQIYRSGHRYFLPPQDQSWKGADKRYNYKRSPTDDDYRRAGPPHS